eukprot:scaffold57951_cov59-Attheya_sp.AAC.5
MALMEVMALMRVLLSERMQYRIDMTHFAGVGSSSSSHFDSCSHRPRTHISFVSPAWSRQWDDWHNSFSAATRFHVAPTCRTGSVASGTVGY